MRCSWYAWLWHIAKECDGANNQKQAKNHEQRRCAQFPASGQNRTRDTYREKRAYKSAIDPTTIDSEDDEKAHRNHCQNRAGDNQEKANPSIMGCLKIAQDHVFGARFVDSTHGRRS
jgi:hypothetical protein